MAVRFVAFLVLLLINFNVSASHIGGLSIEGDDTLPGITGEYSINDEFSWMYHVFPDSASGFSWTLSGGTDGGIVFDQSQAQGEMIDFRPMFNQPTTFYSVNGGLSINADNAIDMSNLMMQHAGVQIDVGAGSGLNTLVPLVADVGSLLDGQNGWMLNGDGTYALVYNTVGTCDGCELTLHLYGSVVPVPAAIWLFISGLVVLAGVGRGLSARH